MTVSSAAPVVISGASGLVGRHLTQALAAEGVAARGVSLRGSAPIELGDASAVVHLAGETVAGRWTPAKRAAILESRRDGTRRLVDAIAAAANRPSVLISASAVGYYGERGDEILTESAGRGVGFLADVCEAWEAQAERAEALGVRVVRLRFGVIFARDADAFRKLVLPFRLGAGGRLGSGRQWWSWVHIDDAIGLIRAALTVEGYRGAINATAPDPLRQGEIARTLGHVLHRPALVPTPEFALNLLLGGFAVELTGSRRVVPARALDLGYRFRHPELEGALRSLVA